MNVLSRARSVLPKSLIVAALLLASIGLPAATIAAQSATIDSSFGVANVSTKDTDYRQAVLATTDQVVKYQVSYKVSDETAKNLNVKITLPEAAGKTQEATAVVKADNGNTVTNKTLVTLDNESANLQYIPGSAVWRHNTGGNYTETSISDSVVTSTQGVRLEDAKTGDANAATVTILARVKVPTVTVSKQVRVDAGGSTFAASNTADAGQTLVYRIVYTNGSDTNQSNVTVRDALPSGLTLVPGTTYVFNQSSPNGSLLNTDAITGAGVDIGSYGPKANAYVTFKATVPVTKDMACGENVYRNVAAVRAKDIQDTYALATTTVNKDCSTGGAKAAVYTCDAFEFSQSAGRKVTVTKLNTTAQNGATFKTAEINWGDSSTPLKTDKPVGQTHAYAKDGTYAIAVTAQFSVNGKDATATSAACSKTVTFTPAAPTTPQVQGDTTEPMPNTGPGSVIALFAATAAAGSIGYYLLQTRRLNRQ